MKKPMCCCYSEKEHLCKEEAYPYIDVPMMGHKTWSSTGKIEVFYAQLKHNYCPQCGTPYREVEE